MKDTAFVEGGGAGAAMASAEERRVETESMSDLVKMCIVDSGALNGFEFG